MRALALKEFDFYRRDGGKATLKKGFAGDVPDEHFGAWSGHGLVIAAPAVCGDPEMLPTASFRDDGKECWLVVGDIDSPRVARKGAVLAVAAWLSVYFGTSPEGSEDFAFMKWAERVLSGVDRQ